MHKNSGFTLVELLIVIGIIAILATLMAPNVIGWMPEYRLKGAVIELGAHVQQARLAAIKENQNCTMSFNTAARTYNITCLDNMTVNLADYDPNISLSVNPSPVINFTSRGLTEGGDGTFEVSMTNLGGSTYEIRITRTGAVATEKL